MSCEIDTTLDHLHEHGNDIAGRYDDGLVVLEEDQELLDEPFNQHETRYDAARTLKDRLHDTYDEVTSMIVIDIREDQIEQYHFAGEALWEEAYATHAGEPAAYLPPR
ncbi:MAG: hypothetical protein SVU32_03430 [Candidatus Nanohaloarchaea archaeon]|nr:hypothetical protein [Candidatus Nanohaloarchaea archaeon]